MTTTLDATTITTSALSTVLLPAEVLHAASLFCSIDAAKPALQAINLQWNHEQQRLGVYSCNGHIAFRMQLPLAACGFEVQPEADCSRNVLLPRRAFSGKKSCNKVLVLEQQVQFIDKGQIKALTPISDCDLQYPNLEQLIPEAFTNTPRRPIGMNVRYIETIAKALALLNTDNCAVQFSSNTATTPLLFSTQWDGDKEVRADALLMPVQLRY